MTQLPGGWLAPRIGASKLYGLGILATAILTLLTPVIAHTGLAPLVAIRILEGIFEVYFYWCKSLFSHPTHPLISLFLLFKFKRVLRFPPCTPFGVAGHRHLKEANLSLSPIRVAILVPSFRWVFVDF